MTIKYIPVNYYDRPYRKYIPFPAEERSNKMQLIKNALGGLVAFIIFWLVIWAMTYTACVGTYHSSVCKQDFTSQIVFRLIK